MITRLTGIVNRVLDDEARLQVGPMEFQILIPEAIRRQIQTSVGTEITLYIAEYFEAAAGGNRFIPRKLGFISEHELEFFDLFCTVDKIGVKKALKAMARPIHEIANAIAHDDAKWLSTLPGIGATSAEQIVATLRKKVTRFTMMSSPVEPGSAGPKSNVSPKLTEDLYLALLALGHQPADARNRLDQLLASGKPFKDVQEGITLLYQA